MKDVIFKSVVFVENGDNLHGYYFYDSESDSEAGHIFGIHQLTLPKALAKLKEVDPIKNLKMTISVYYW